MKYLYEEDPAPIISANPFPTLFFVPPSEDPSRKEQINLLIQLNCPEKCAEKNRANVWQRFAKGLEVLRP